MILRTARHCLTKLFAANIATSAAITSPVPTITEPVGDGIIDLRSIETANNIVELLFHGTGASTQTATARITAWRSLGNLWIPKPLLILNLALGPQAGVAAQGVLNTEFFVSTITALTAFTTASEIINPDTDGTVGAVFVDPKGADKIQVQLTRGTCASINGLWASL